MVRCLSGYRIQDNILILCYILVVICLLGYRVQDHLLIPFYDIFVNLQGSVAITGAAVRWLRDNLGMIQDAKDIGMAVTYDNTPDPVSIPLIINGLVGFQLVSVCFAYFHFVL